MHHKTLPVLLVVFLLGCGGQDEWSSKRPKVYSAGGVVKLDGQPLEGAVVVYHSQSHQIAAQGTSDAEGRFELTTFDDQDGAADGPHKVVVTKRVYEQVKTKYDSPEEASVASIPKDVLPLKYAAPTTTDIEVTINADGDNDAVIELKSK